MPKSRRKLIAQLKQADYALLRDTTDEGVLDGPTLEASVQGAVTDRFALARAFIEAAKLLIGSDNALVRRNAISRAYYGVYHAARATVFAVHRRDEDDHIKLAQVVDAVVGAAGGIQTALKEMRKARDEMDYSPYPGPDATTEYAPQQIEEIIGDCVRRAEELMGVFDQYLRERR